MKKFDPKRPALMEDLETLAAHIIDAINITLKDLATKEDIKKLTADIKGLATKTDVKELNGKVDNLQSDVTDIKRRVRDLETDTPTIADFNKLKKQLKN